MTNFRVEGVGITEFKELLEQIKDDFGPKDTQNILRNSVRLSMRTVLETARALVPRDTGQLAASLQIETRKPTSRDKKSKYVSANDIVIGKVTAYIGKEGHRRTFKSAKSGAKTEMQSDARAIAMEFGTAKVAAKPYLRPALESNTTVITTNLGDSLKQSLEKYKARQARKTL